MAHGRDYTYSVRSLAVLAVLACACSHADRPPVAAEGRLVITAPDAGPVDGGQLPTVTGPTRMLDGLYYVMEGAPEPLVCQRDRDCIGDTVTDDTGCCVRTPESHAQTWAWHNWVTGRRLGQDCDKVTCPPLPVSGMPSACKLEVKCKNNRCADTCDEAAPDGGPQAPRKMPD